jgi:hypothetical protein
MTAVAPDLSVLSHDLSVLSHDLSVLSHDLSVLSHVATRVHPAAAARLPQEKGDSGVRLPEKLQEPLAAVRNAARRVGKVASECKLPLNVDEYVQSFRPELMEVRG